MATIINADTSDGLKLTSDTSGQLELQSAGSTKVTMDTSGNVGIGTSNPAGSMHLLRSSDPQFIITDDLSSSFALGTTTGYSTIGTDASAITFKTGVTTGSVFSTGTERMRIVSDGTVLIADTSTSPYFDGNLNVYKSGNIAFCAKTDSTNSYVSSLYNSATTGNNLFLGFVTETLYNLRGGISYNRGAGLVAYNTTSDERLKENIVDASSALSKIDSVKVRSFDWKETGNHVDFGVIAQELISVAPECVTEGQDNDDGTIKNAWSVDTSALVPALVKAIQEQQTIINDLKARIETLEAK